MTWAEFRIRLHAYHRQDKYDWLKVREIAYHALIAPNVNPKRLPKTKEAFIPLNRKKGMTDSMRKRIEEVQKEYLRQKAELDGK